MENSDSKYNIMSTVYQFILTLESWFAVILDYDGNAFIDELYSTIYTGILQNCPKDAADLICNVKDKLESPQKCQFVSLFVKLKIKNVAYLFNVIRICCIYNDS